MRRERCLIFLAAVILLPMIAGGDALAGSTHCRQGWRAFPLPNEATLVTADAVSRSDVWAAGDHFTAPGDVLVVEHFDGSGWTRVPVATPQDWTNVYPASVEMRSADDGWLGGQLYHATGDEPFLMHWDGVRWQPMSTPDDGAVSVTAISAIAAGDAWAVGTADVSGLRSGVAMHWDGSSWTDSPLPDQTLQWNLDAVKAIAPDDVWAAGTVGGSSLVLHWDGTTWTQAPTPFTTDQQAPIRLHAIVGTTNELWAYGSTSDDLCCEGGYSLHWDGATWTEGPTFGPRWDADTNGLDTWTVEGWGGGDATVSHFDGSVWTYSSPKVRLGPGLDAVAAVPNHVWVFGAIRLRGAPNWALRSC